MLNLRELAHGGERQDVTTLALSQFSMVQIAHPDIIGDLGAPLSHGASTEWASFTELGRVSHEGEDLEPFEAESFQVRQLEKGGPLTAGLLDARVASDDSTHSSSAVRLNAW